MSTFSELPGYCGAVSKLGIDPVHKSYHDNEYGFPIRDNDNALFERLILEINQAGLSWETILKKRTGFSLAYDNFEIQKVANFGDTKVNELLSDSGIIRNRLKIMAAIHNAQVILALQSEFGSFENWLDKNALELGVDKILWVKLFKNTFKFTGGEITGEFLMSLGYLPGAHVEGCPVLEKIRKTNPWWSR